MSSADAPLDLDLADFDAVGLAGDIVMRIREHALTYGIEARAIVSAPDAWHQLIIGCGPTGNLELQIRLDELTTSRRKNLTKAIVDRDWQLDEDRDGARRRFRSGTDSLDIAFEALATLTLAGAPGNVRTVTAVDANGAAVPLAG